MNQKYNYYMNYTNSEKSEMIIPLNICICIYVNSYKSSRYRYMIHDNKSTVVYS